jgi:hypothetical protein
MSKIPSGYEPFDAKIFQIRSSLDELTENYLHISINTDNINTNLSGLIEDYSSMLNSFETSIEKQKNLDYNQPPLSENKYEIINSKYTTLKKWNESLLSEIDVIKRNLVYLAGIVENVNKKANEYIDFFNNRNMSKITNSFNEMEFGGKKTKKHLRSRRVRKRKSMKQKKHNKKYIGGNDYYENV